MKEKKVSLTNKILSIYTSPLKEPSSTFTDSIDKNKNFQLPFSEIKNKNIHNSRYQLTKITRPSKIRFLDSKRENIVDEENINNKIDKNKKKMYVSDEKKYYEKIRNKTKEFILEKKFNKKFRYELNRIKPWQYRTFYNK